MCIPIKGKGRKSIPWTWDVNTMLMKNIAMKVQAKLECSKPIVHVFSNKKYVYKKHEAEIRQKLRKI